MNNTGKILLFQLPKQKAAQIKTLCDQLNIQTAIVSPSEYSKTLGQLTGLQQSAPSNALGQNAPQPCPALPGLGIPQMEMLVFSGLSSDMLDVFLAEYKKAAIESVPLKAVVTPVNRNWDIRTLYSELLKEHMQFSK